MNDYIGLSMNKSDKKEEIISIEQDLFNSNKSSKNIKQKEYEFNTNIYYNINKYKIDLQVSKFGNISKSEEFNIEEKEEEFENEEMEETNSMAMKQKLNN